MLCEQEAVNWQHAEAEEEQDDKLQQQWEQLQE